jgi:hydrogenase/urease accessory protein HupE
MSRWSLVVVTVVGFIIAVAGVAMLSVPFAAIVCGASLVAFGLLVNFDKE